MMMWTGPPLILNKLPLLQNIRKWKRITFLARGSLIPILCRIDRKSQCRIQRQWMHLFMIIETAFPLKELLNLQKAARSSRRVEISVFERFSGKSDERCTACSQPALPACKKDDPFFHSGDSKSRRV